MPFDFLIALNQVFTNLLKVHLVAIANFNSVLFRILYNGILPKKAEVSFIIA